MLFLNLLTNLKTLYTSCVKVSKLNVALIMRNIYQLNVMDFKSALRSTHVRTSLRTNIFLRDFIYG